MFKYIRNHFGVFYYVAWGVFLALFGIGELIEWAVGEMPEAVYGLLLLPSNLISWPVALGYWETGDQKSTGMFAHKRLKMIITLLGTTTLAPLMFFCM